MFIFITRGSEYMNLWPDEKVLGFIFPELRVKKTLNLAKKLIPPFIVFLMVWAFVVGGGLSGIDFIYTQKGNLPVTIVCILFLLSIPLHGYYWFYKRSNLKLNKKQKVFYEELMKDLGKSYSLDPCMYDFIKSINLGLSVYKSNEFLNKL